MAGVACDGAATAWGRGAGHGGTLASWKPTGKPTTPTQYQIRLHAMPCPLTQGPNRRIQHPPAHPQPLTRVDNDALRVVQHLPERRQDCHGGRVGCKRVLLAATVVAHPAQCGRRINQPCDCCGMRPCHHDCMAAKCTWHGGHARHDMLRRVCRIRIGDGHVHTCATCV